MNKGDTASFDAISDSDIKKAKENTKEKNKNNHKARTGIIIAASILAVLLVAVTGFGIYVTGTDTIFSGVTVDGAALGGMTREQAVEYLDAAGWSDNADAAVTVLLPLGREVTVTPSEAGAEVTPIDAAIAAYNYGHSGNIFSNLVTYVKCFFGPHEVNLAVTADEAVVRDKVEEAVAEVKAGLMTSGVEIDEESVFIIKGAKAVNVDTDEICSIIITALEDRDYGEREYKVEVEEAAELDIDELYDTIYAEPEDAYYDAEAGEVVPSVTGYDFDKEEAEALWNAADYGDTIEIPLVVTEPELTTEKLDAMLFADVLSTATTSLYGSSQNRIDNITLAADIINGTVLKPGEMFSYNETVGKRTAERGFKYAGAYSGGQVVQEIGGGICQVSSTIYYCSLLANLEINDRTCHYFPVAYLPAGLDATVSWKIPDYKFTNSREYPIRIETEVNTEDNTLTIRIMGTDVDGSYVQMTYASWLVYNNEDYPDIATGYKAATYRWVYDKDGNLLSKELEAYSEYHYHEEDIELPEESPSPSPSESPDVSAEPSPSASASPSPSESPETTPTEPVETTSPTDVPETTPTPTEPVG